MTAFLCFFFSRWFFVSVKFLEKNADFLQKHAQQILYGHEDEESVFRPNELT